jgi:hypothetical protein
MATEVELGVRTLGEQAADRPSDKARNESLRRSRNDRSIWQQFLENLMSALGAWHV